MDSALLVLERAYAKAFPPRGLGLQYPSLNEPFGVAPNDLTDLDDRDPWVGTPWHKHVPARLEPVSPLATA